MKLEKQAMANRVGPHDLEQGRLILISDGNRLVDFNLENDGLCLGILQAHCGCLVLW